MKKKTAKIFVALFTALILMLATFLSACTTTPSDDPDGPGPDTPPAEKTVSAIEISKAPDKVAYFTGEVFDPAGMEISAIYSDDSKAVLERSAWDYLPKRALTLEDNVITIRSTAAFGSKQCTQAITVTEDTISGETYTFEAEEAELGGVFNPKASGAAEQYAGLAADCYNIVEKEEASGGAALYNFNVAGNTVTWTFEADTAARAQITIRIACRYASKKFQTKSFDEMYTLSVNNVEVKVGKDVGPTDPNAAANYYDFQTVSVNVSLKAGENTVKLTEVEGESGNLDCMMLMTSANITDTTNGVKHALTGGWTVSVAPTTTSTGTLSDGCTKCSFGKTVTLPMLTDTEAYDYEVVDEATNDTDGLGRYTYKGEEKKSDGTAFTFDVVIPAENKTAYRFEAEKAAITGHSSASGNPEVSCANIKFVETASEGACLFSVNRSDNTITFKINASEATTATLTVRIACRAESGVPVEKKFGDMLTLSVNGSEGVKYDAVVAPQEGEEGLGAYAFQTVTLGNIELVEGENTLVFTNSTGPKSNGNAQNGVVGNFDYIELLSKAELTDLLTSESEGVYSHHIGAWEKGVNPTELTAGTLVKKCETCGLEMDSHELPALNETDYALTTDGETGDKTYTYTFDGQNFEYEVKAPVVTPPDEWKGPEANWMGNRLMGDKDFFNPESWTKTAPTLEEDGSLKFEGEARIDYLGEYVEGTKRNHLNNSATNEVLNGKSFTYTFSVKATGSFGILLYAKSSAGWTSKTNRALFVEFNSNGKISFKNGNKGSGVGATSEKEFFISASHFTRIDIVINRAEDGARYTLELYVDGELVKLVPPAGKTSSTNITAEEGIWTATTNDNGGSLDFIPGGQFKGDTDTEITSGVTLWVTTPEESRYQAPETEPGTSEQIPEADLPNKETM